MGCCQHWHVAGYPRFVSKFQHLETPVSQIGDQSAQLAASSWCAKDRRSGIRSPSNVRGTARAPPSMAPVEAAAGAGGANPNGGEAGEASGGLTADEATVYDRQLRVWGVEVQRKCEAAAPRDVCARGGQGKGGQGVETAPSVSVAGARHQRPPTHEPPPRTRDACPQADGRARAHRRLWQARRRGARRAARSLKGGGAVHSRAGARVL